MAVLLSRIVCGDGSMSGISAELNCPPRWSEHHSPVEPGLASAGTYRHMSDRDQCFADLPEHAPKQALGSGLWK